MKSSTLLPSWLKLVVASVWLGTAPSPNASAQQPRSADTNTNQRKLWKPVTDDVYLQEIGEKIPTDKPVTVVAVLGNNVHVVIGAELKTIRDGVLVESPNAPKGIRRLKSLGGALWAAAEAGAFRFTGNTWEKVDAGRFTDFCLHLGQVYGATSDDIFRFENNHFVNIRPPGGYLSSDITLVMEDFSQVLPDPVQIGPVERIASYSGTLYLLRPGRLALLDGKTLVTA